MMPLGFIISFLIPTAICIPKSSYGLGTEAVNQKVNGPIAPCKTILHPNEASATDVGMFAGEMTAELLNLRIFGLLLL